MKVLVTGATGYIGGSVATMLAARGHTVVGLTRDETKAPLLASAGIIPLIGTLDDAEILARESKSADAVVNAADADHRSSLEAILDAIAGTGKALIHTSGSSVVGDDARGNSLSEVIYDENSTWKIEERKLARHEINSLVLESAARGVRSVIICPSLIYGIGGGINPNSIQVPFLVEQAQESGKVRVVGKGLNRWSTVHIDDLSDLYSLVLDSAPAGSFYFAENGEASFAEIGAAIADRLGMNGVDSWDPEEAAGLWGPGRAYFTYGSNSRVRAARARKELGWKPAHDSVLRWILDQLPISEKERQQ
ncbi:NAD-dependent epimerase/dehydratase family protein [Arthrobacter sp. 31Y]|uniref:NAD-dependent epimerase/dehydratase family protein n=1 Tax=Arthrobacter sp. 31Y TaxID=1115632 RepID=UPI000465BE58|nr:NAD-dependent epimerase/dehydratase family protein [Arthrobacter sp. 31Y]